MNSEEKILPEENKRLDEKITAVCACEKEQKILTYRTLKNKWPHCSCKMSMKVLTNAT
tara:strand:+ start:1295 stop:1468 length:174 start_codon:yes stop_codon:yes gene_type:complete